MPKIKSPGLPQINAGQMLYGSIDIELFPDGTAPLQIPLWDGVQWHFATITAGVGISVTYNADENTIEISNSDYVLSGSFSADSVLLVSGISSFTADSVFLVSGSGSFTADSLLA